MSHLQRNQSEPIDQLFQGILSLDTVDECYTFFSDLFTIKNSPPLPSAFRWPGYCWTAIPMRWSAIRSR